MHKKSDSDWRGLIEMIEHHVTGMETRRPSWSRCRSGVWTEIRTGGNKGPWTAGRCKWVPVILSGVPPSSQTANPLKYHRPLSSPPKVSIICFLPSMCDKTPLQLLKHYSVTLQLMNVLSIVTLIAIVGLENARRPFLYWCFILGVDDAARLLTMFLSQSLVDWFGATWVRGPRNTVIASTE